jgi:hypothetical protein
MCGEPLDRSRLDRRCCLEPLAKVVNWSWDDGHSGVEALVERAFAPDPSSVQALPEEC